MPSVDNRVVEMHFDNKQFESGVSTSIKSLDKLKKGLDLDKSSKSLSNLEKTAKGFNLSGIASGVETIAGRFTNLGIVGVTALQNITTAAMNAGSQIMNALTIEPIKMGFQEYETQINAVQTILANTSSKGTTLAQVNNALDELNKYADMTIYNFTEMTRNIGTFTAAGVDLDTSVSAIKGIANLAAVSGSNSQQAATAMYQLSQALASGTVKLQDWNSVVNAGMGGQVFQDSLKETARVHGVKIDEMIKKEGSFRETLKNEWLTSQILTETLAKFTGDLSEEQLRNMGYTEEQTKAIMKMGETANDAATKVKTFTQLFDTLNEAMQSGWTQSWEYIIGDYEEAKESLTQISDMFSEIINQSADARNQVLKEWSELGGRTELFQGLLSAVEVIFSYIRPIQEGLQEIIPPITGQKLYELTVKLHNFIDSMKLSEETANRVKEIVKNFAQAFKNVIDGAREASGGLDKVKESMRTVGEGILSVLENFSRFVKNVSEGINFFSVFGTSISVVSSGIGILGKALSWVANLITIFAETLSTMIVSGAQAFTETLSGASSFADAFVEILIAIIERLPEIIGTAIRAVGDVIRAILEAVPIHEVNAAIQDTLFTLILANVNKFLGQSREKVEEAKTIFDRFGEIADSVSGLLDGVKGSIKSFSRSIQADALLKIAIALGILAASLWALSQIPLEQLGVGLAAMATGMIVFTGIAMGALAILKKMSGSVIDTIKLAVMASQFRKIAVAMLLFAAATKILVSALKDISELAWDELIKGLVGLAGIAGIMIGISKLMKSVDGIIRMAFAMTLLSVALQLFSNAIKDLGQLSWEELIRGLIGVAAGIGIMIVAMKIMQKGTWGLIVSTIAIFGISVALKMLSETIKAFSDVDYQSLGKAAIALISIAAGLKILSMAMSKVKLFDIIKMTAALLVVSSTLKTFAEAASMFNDIQWAAVAKLSTTMVLILGTMAAFSAIAGKTKFLEISGGLWAVSEAVRTFVSATKELSSMDWPTLFKGIAGIVGGLGSMILALNLIPEKLIVRKAASLMIVSMCMKVMADALKELGNMSIKEIAKSLITYAGAMTIMVVALKALGNTKGLVRAGISISLVALGIAMIAGPLKTLGNMNLSEMVQGLAGMAAALIIVSAAVKALGSQLKSMLSTAAGLAAMGAAITIFGIGLAVMIYTVKELAGLGFEGMASGLSGLAIMIGTMYALVESINKMPKVSPANIAKAFVLAVIIGLLGAVVQQLSTIDTVSALEGATAMAEIILSVSVAMTILGAVDVKTALMGVASLAIIIAGLGAIVAAMGGLAQIPGAKWLMSEGKQFLQSIGEAIGSFFGGLAGGVVGGVMNSVASALPGLGSSLSAFTNNARPFFDSIRGIDPNLGPNVANIAAAVLMITGSDILSSATTWLTGGNSMEKFGQQLAAFAPYFKQYADEIKDVNPSVVEASANAAKSLAEMADSLPKEGGLFQKITGISSLTKFAEELLPFGQALKEYSETVQEIDVAPIHATTEAAQGLADLYNSLDEVGGVVGWFMGERDMDKFANGIVKLGETLVTYSETVSNGNIDPQAIAQATEALERLSALNNSMDNIGGLVSAFEGEKDLSYFARGVASLGDAIAGYSEAVSNVESDPQKVTASIEALKSLADVNSALPSIGGIASFFMGAPQMEYFATGIKELGSAIADYCEVVSGKEFNAEKVSASINAIKALSEINNASEKIGGIISIFEGEPNLEYFSKGIVALGGAIADYCEVVSGKEFNAEKVSSSINAIKALAEASDSIQKVGGLIDIFEGRTDYEGFTQGITALGTALNSYCSEIENINVDEAKMTSSVNAIKMLAEAGEMIGNAGGIEEWGNGNKAEGIRQFASVLGDVGTGVSTFASNIGDASYEMVEPAAEALRKLGEVSQYLNDIEPEGIKKFSDTIKEVGDMGLPAFNEALSTSATEVSQKFSEFATAISEGAGKIGEALDTLKQKLKDESSLYKEAGNDIGKALMEGLGESIDGMRDDVVNKFEEVCKAMVDKAVEYFDRQKERMKTAGRNLANSVITGFKSVSTDGLGLDIIRGIANGIANNSYIAENAAAAAARNALTAAKNALDSNSPSKEFMKLGEDSDKGLAIGFNNMTKYVKRSAANVATEAFKSSYEALDAFNTLSIDSMINPLDTIRPIVDASSYATRNYELLSNSLMRNAAYATGDYGFINPVIQVDNSEVVKEIRVLQRELDTLIQNGSGDTVLTIDGKTVAKVTAKPMNRQLGMISARGGIT